jgi:hypothetical protein
MNNEAIKQYQADLTILEAAYQSGREKCCFSYEA